MQNNLSLNLWIWMKYGTNIHAKLSGNVHFMYDTSYFTSFNTSQSANCLNTQLEVTHDSCQIK